MKPGNVSIVSATPRQAYSILVMTRAYFPYVQLTFDELNSRLKGQPKGEHQYIVAKNNGHTIGYAHLAYDKGKPTARILGLAVLEQYRRKGLGKRLLRRALSIAKKRGVSRVNLLVRADNQAALAMYAKDGFTVKGKLKRPFEGQQIMVLSKSLAPKPSPCVLSIRD